MNVRVSYKYIELKTPRTTVVSDDETEDSLAHNEQYIIFCTTCMKNTLFVIVHEFDTYGSVVLEYHQCCLCKEMMRKTAIPWIYIVINPSEELRNCSEVLRISDHLDRHSLRGYLV